MRDFLANFLNLAFNFWVIFYIWRSPTKVLIQLLHARADSQAESKFFILSKSFVLAIRHKINFKSLHTANPFYKITNSCLIDKMANTDFNFDQSKLKWLTSLNIWFLFLVFLWLGSRIL